MLENIKQIFRIYTKIQKRNFETFLITHLSDNDDNEKKLNYLKYVCRFLNNHVSCVERIFTNVALSFNEAPSPYISNLFPHVSNLSQ